MIIQKIIFIFGVRWPFTGRTATQRPCCKQSKGPSSTLFLCSKISFFWRTSCARDFLFFINLWSFYLNLRLSIITPERPLFYSRHRPLPRNIRTIGPPNPITKSFRENRFCFRTYYKFVPITMNLNQNLF